MKLKLRLFLPLLLVMLGVFGASFSLHSFAASPSDFNYSYHWSGTDYYYCCNSPLFGIEGFQSASPLLLTNDSNPLYIIQVSSSGNFTITRKPINIYFGDTLLYYFQGMPLSFYSESSVPLYSSLPSFGVYDEDIILSNIKAFYLGATGLVVSPVYSAFASENVDHVDVKIYKDDLNQDPLYSYSYRPTGPFHMFTGSGGTVSFSDGLGKTIVTMVPYSVNGNYGATYYATITPFGLRNTYYVDVPKKSGGSGTLDFNSYTQTNVSYSPTSNINQSTQVSSYYYRTYNLDQSTVEEFYNTYDYSVTDNSYYSDNDLTFNTNIEITIPTIDGSWLKSLFQGFDFNISIDLLNFWIPGVPSWIIDLLIAGIAIIVAAVIAKVVFEIL